MRASSFLMHPEAIVELFFFFCYNTDALEGARPLHHSLYSNIKAG